MERWGRNTLVAGSWCLAAVLGVMAALPARAGTEAGGIDLRIASITLPSVDAPEWPQQRARIRALLQELGPDVIAVQQVRHGRGRLSSACWLASALEYSCDFVSTEPPSQPLRHGQAMLSRRTVVEDGVTLLHPPSLDSAAGMLRLQLGEQLVNIYMARITPDDDVPAIRKHQINDLMTWIAATDDGLPSIIVGEFASPTPELVRLTPGFQPSRRNPDGAALPADGRSGAAHGRDVLFQVRPMAGLSQRAIVLPADEALQLPALPLGMLATVRLTVPETVDTASARVH